MDNPDNDKTTDDLPFTSRGVVDVNNIAEIPNATTLSLLVQLKVDVTSNFVIGSKILNQYDCDTYFTLAIPTIFPYGIGKHRETRREDRQHSLLKSLSLML